MAEAKEQEVVYLLIMKYLGLSSCHCMMLRYTTNDENKRFYLQELSCKRHKIVAPRQSDLPDFSEKKSSELRCLAYSKAIRFSLFGDEENPGADRALCGTVVTPTSVIANGTVAINGAAILGSDLAPRLLFPNALQDTMERTL